MTKATKTSANIGTSVRKRLLKRATESREDYQLLLLRYANERLLYRLSVSSHAPSFVLKGAVLFTLWTGRAHRPTRDIDLLGFGEPTERRLRAVFEDVIRAEVEDDGVTFDSGSLEVGSIREAQDYGGIRVSLRAEVAGARLKLQVDVGFGDAITPLPELVEFPPLLDFTAPKLRAYPRATVVAEKLEAMVKLGLLNSRMKDFYDVLIMARSFSFDADELARAIRATFERRGTALPEVLPVAFTEEFASDAMKQTQWAGFVRKADAADDVRDLTLVIREVNRFLATPLAGARTLTPSTLTWVPAGPWRRT